MEWQHDLRQIRDSVAYLCHNMLYMAAQLANPAASTSPCGLWYWQRPVTPLSQLDVLLDSHAGSTPLELPPTALQVSALDAALLWKANGAKQYRLPKQQRKPQDAE